MDDATYGMTRTYVELTDAQARRVSHQLREAGYVHMISHTDRRAACEAQVDQRALDDVKHLCFIHTLCGDTMRVLDVVDHLLHSNSKEPQCL